MKNTSSLKRWSLLTLLIALLPGCLDIYLDTTINRNGSITKHISLEGDSTEIIGNTFFAMLDSTWDTTWTTLDKDKRRFSASITFRNTKEFNSIFNPSDSTKIQIRANAVLKKKFRWFFTYYEYQESLLAANTMNYVDWRDYLSEEEVRLIYLDEDDRKADSAYSEPEYKDTEKRLTDFLTNSTTAEFIHLLLSLPEIGQSTGITAERIEKERKDYISYLSDSVSSSNITELIKATSDFFGAPGLDSLASMHPGNFELFSRKLEFMETSWDDSYKLSLTMPGLIISSEAESLEGNTSKWEVGIFHFFFTDFTMKAESRVINNWAFIVAGIVLIIFVVSLFASLFKKQK